MDQAFGIWNAFLDQMCDAVGQANQMLRMTCSHRNARHLETLEVGQVDVPQIGWSACRRPEPGCNPLSGSALFVLHCGGDNIEMALDLDKMQISSVEKYQGVLGTFEATFKICLDRPQCLVREALEEVGAGRVEDPVRRILEPFVERVWKTAMEGWGGPREARI